MKTILFILIVLLLNVCRFFNANAQCPPGSSLETYTFLYTYNYPPPSTDVFTCEVDVIYCCRYDGTSNEAYADLIGVYSHDGSNCVDNIPNWNDFVFNYFIFMLIDAQSACGPELPPCGTGNYEVRLSSSPCVKVENVKLDPMNPNSLWKHHYIFCPGEAECVSTYEVCKDYSVVPFVNRTTLVYQALIGEPDCQTTRPAIPPAGKTETEYWVTPCFSIPCPGQ